MTSVFVSAFTIYAYDNEYRENLNLQEAEKFWSGLEHARGMEKIYVFTDVDFKKIPKIMKKFTKAERDAITKKVLSQIDIYRERGTLNIIPVDLYKYDETYNAVKDAIEDLEKNNKVEKIYANLSCGHKVGALAIYTSLLNFTHKRGKRVEFKPFHAEEVITHLPNVNISSRTMDDDYEKYLEIFVNPITYEEAKEKIKKMGNRDREVEKILMNLLDKRKLIEMRNGKIILTKRGRTLLALNHSLEGR